MVIASPECGGAELGGWAVSGVLPGAGCFISALVLVLLVAVLASGVAK